MCAITKTVLSNAEDVADEMLRKHGRSFYWARHFLGRETARRSTLLYSFCRFLDDVADGDLPGGLELLNLIRAQIDAGTIKGTSDVIPEVQIFMRLSAEVGIPSAAALDLIDGLIFDQGTVAIENEAELIVYAYRVAGTVGLMMSPILGRKDPHADAFAIDLGIGMQLSNIARDVAEDAVLGRRYLPSDWCHDVSAQEIRGALVERVPEYRCTVSRATVKTVDLAEVYYKSGIAGLRYLPLRNNIAIGIAAFVYRAIGRRLKRKGCKWWQGREVVGPSGKLLASTQSLGRLVSPPRFNNLHNKKLHAPLQSLESFNV